MSGPWQVEVEASAFPIAGISALYLFDKLAKLDNY